MDIRLCLLTLFIIAIASCSQADKRYQKLSLKNSDKTLVSLTSDSLMSLASEAHNYSVIVFFTAEGHNVDENCPLCGPGLTEFRKVFQEFREALGSEGYNSSTFTSNPVFFTRCPLPKCYDVAIKIGLQGLPEIAYIPPQPSHNEYWEAKRMPNLWDDFSAPSIADFVRSTTSFPIYVARPLVEVLTPYLITGAALLFIIFGVIPFLKKYYRHPMFWFALSLIGYGATMSGQVFNAIHKPPNYWRHPQTGQYVFVYPQLREQFVFEGIGIAAIMLFGGLSVVGLNTIAVGTPDPWQQRVFALMFIVFTWGSFHLLRIANKIKQPYYPF